MSATSRILRSALRRIATRFMDRVGSRFVSGIADTSSDAPDAAFTPKRDLYRQMKDASPAARGGGSGAE